MATPVQETNVKDPHPDVYPQGNPHKRVRRRAVVRTWLILAAMMAIYALVFGIIYWLEPGIR